MMRRLVERHEGALPLATVEHIWREIITTFTRMQAPFDVAIDISVEPERMRDLARFVFGFSVELVPVAGPGRSSPRLPKPTTSASSRAPPRAAVVARFDREGAPRIMALLPFIDVPDRPADLPAFVISPPLADPTPMDLAAPGTDAASDDGRRGHADILAAAGRRHPARRAVAGGCRRERGRRRGGVAGAGSAVSPAASPSTGPPTLLYEARRRRRPKANRQVPRPGILDIAAYVPGRSKAVPGVQAAQAVVERDAARPEPGGDRGLPRGRRLARALPGRRGDGAPQRHRRGLRPQSRSHRLRRRLGRGPAPHRQCLHRPRRRGDPHRVRLPRLSDRDPGRRRHAGRGAERNRSPPMSTRSLARVSPTGRASSSSPIPTIRPAPTCRSARCAGCMPRCRQRCCSSSMRPTPSTCAATTTRAASSSPAPPKTW